MAAYADLTLVDKRTLENVRRAKAGSAEFADLIGEVAKAAIYSDVAAAILRLERRYDADGQPRPAETG